jgi:hypothetical protein
MAARAWLVAIERALNGGAVWGDWWHVSSLGLLIATMMICLVAIPQCRRVYRDGDSGKVVCGPGLRTRRCGSP